MFESDLPGFSMFEETGFERRAVLQRSHPRNAIGRDY